MEHKKSDSQNGNVVVVRVYVHSNGNGILPASNITGGKHRGRYTSTDITNPSLMQMIYSKVFWYNYEATPEPSQGDMF